MARHRTHRIEFKRQVAQDYLAGETLHSLARRHDLSRNLIRIWIQKFEAGAFDDEAVAADLILDRTGLLLGDLGGEQIADDALRLVLALHRRGDDLVEGGLHAKELELAHGGENLGAFRHTALLRLS